MNRAKRYHDVSLHPPTHPPPRRTSSGSGSGAGDALLPWVFLDNKAYIADNRNHTTAYSRTRDENEIQASFFLAEPPAVSHCCFSRTDSKDPTVFGQEPRLVAAEANLVLFLCIHGSPSNFCRREMHDYYVYQAAGGVPPSLKLLPHPPPDVFPDNGAYYFHNRQAGLLRYSTTKRDDGGAGRFTLRRHGFSTYDQYIIAALCPEGSVLGKFLLCTYDSKTGTWSSRLAVLDVDEQRRRQLPDAPEECGRVITIDEDVGTMGWVDLWKGILVADVLPLEKETPVPILYTPLPPFTWQNKPPGGPASMYRDIAVVQGRIKFAEVRMHIRPVSYKPRTFVSDGWTAVTWSRTANSLEEEWHKEFEVHAHEVSVDNMSGFELLPELVDDKGTPQPTLERIHIGHPKLSRSDNDDNDICYFTAKVHHRDPEAWVIAIDMRKKALRGVTKFGGAPRILTLGDSYTPSCISGHLTTAAATAADNTKNLLKRPGMPLSAPSQKVVIQTQEYGVQMEQLGFHVEEDEEDNVECGADDDDDDDGDGAMDLDWC